MAHLPFRALILVLLLVTACQSPPTRVVDRDEFAEEKSLAQLEIRADVDPKNAVIIDVRSPFAYSLSRLPRSFSVLAHDWDLDRYRGDDLIRKAKELQNLLALKGIDPWTPVLIYGDGLAGSGEEFLLAANLFRLGVTRISFLNQEKAKTALRARDFQAVANVAKWERPLRKSLLCPSHAGPNADLLIKSHRASEFFDANLRLRSGALPKNLNRVESSPGTYWALGLVLQSQNQGRGPCARSGSTRSKKKENIP